MDWKAHLLVGCIFGAAAGSSVFSLSPLELSLFSAIAGISALLPDLDLRKSKSSQLLYGFLALAIVAAASYLSGQSGGRSFQDFVLYALLLAAGVLALDFLIRPRHRGVMHGMLFLAASSVAAFFLLGQFFASAFFLGYASHLLADMCIKA